MSITDSAACPFCSPPVDRVFAHNEIAVALWDGYNIGINGGASAGQTVLQLYVRLIRRFLGDVTDPRGGVRHVRALTTLAAMLLSGCINMPATSPPASTARIAPALSAAARRLAAGAPASEYAQGPVRVDAHGRLQVYVSVNAVTAEHVQTLRAAGLSGARPSAALALVQGWVPPERLRDLAALPFVTRIAPPRYARTR